MHVLKILTELYEYLLTHENIIDIFTTNIIILQTQNNNFYVILYSRRNLRGGQVFSRKKYSSNSLEINVNNGEPFLECSTLNGYPVPNIT